jgi:hypothetical protein
MKFGKTAISLLTRAYSSKYKTVIVDVGQATMGTAASYGARQDEAAKGLVSEGYFELVASGKYKMPMERLNGFYVGTKTKYRITRFGKKAMEEEQ